MGCWDPLQMKPHKVSHLLLAAAVGHFGVWPFEMYIKYCRSSPLLRASVAWNWRWPHSWQKVCGAFCLHLFVYRHCLVCCFFPKITALCISFISHAPLLNHFFSDKCGNLMSWKKNPFHVNSAVHIHAEIVSNFENLHTCALPSCVIFYAWLPPLLLKQLLCDRWTCSVGPWH